jgi:hypothetical protein
VSRRAQRRLPRVALTHFQQAFAQINSRIDVVRPQPKRVPVEIGGDSIFAIQDHHFGERHQRVVSLRRDRKNAQESGARACTVVPLQMQITERHA